MGVADEKLSGYMPRGEIERRYREYDEPVPGFLLIKYLGTGAFSEVWRARAAGGVDVAMKILYPIDRRAGRMAYNALHLVKNIKSPHLVPIFAFWLKDANGNILNDDVAPEFGMESRGDSFVLENASLTDTLVPGTHAPDNLREPPDDASRPAELIITMGLADDTLFDCMKRYRNGGEPGIPRDRLIEYLEGAAKGLDFLNVQHGTQHCDIKPQNILLTGGQGQVADFDLVKNLGDPRTTTTIGYSLAYVAPEVFNTGLPSPTSDQYALAVSYCELLTGRLPYTKEEVQIVIAEKLAGRLDLSGLPKGDRKIIEKATALNPKQRYRNSSDMIRELHGGDGRSWAWFLKRVTAMLGVLAVGVGIWALPVWKPYDLVSIVRTLLVENQVRQAREALEMIIEHPPQDVSEFTPLLSIMPPVWSSTHQQEIGRI